MRHRTRDPKPASAVVLIVAVLLGGGCRTRPELAAGKGPAGLDIGAVRHEVGAAYLDDIRDLCRGDFRARSVARVRLLDAGREALPALEAAARHAARPSYAAAALMSTMEAIQERLGPDELLAETEREDLRRLTALRVLDRRRALAVARHTPLPR